MVSKIEYDVGDYVVITDVEKCKWGYNKYMKKLSGLTAKIVSKEYSVWTECNKYRIDIDNEEYIWTEECFRYSDVKELPAFEPPDEGSIMSLLF